LLNLWSGRLLGQILQELEQMRWWPKTIKWQLLASLLALEVLSIALYGVFLLRQQTNEMRQQAQTRLAYQATALARQAAEALMQQRSEWVRLSVEMMGESPTVSEAKITDPAGHVLFTSKGGEESAVLRAEELIHIGSIRHEQPQVFNRGREHWESVRAIYTGGELRGFAWVVNEEDWSTELAYSVVRHTTLFGLIWGVASVLLVLVISRSISGPLLELHRGTRALIQEPEAAHNFPLPVKVHNELGELIEAFNRMVASLQEQRSGLHDTLSLLDSMLANAPIGLAYFDRSCRFVRVNEVFAGLTGLPLSRHLGRTLPDLLPAGVAQQLEGSIFRVFADQKAIRTQEVNGESEDGRPWTWLVSSYPVLTNPRRARWVGVIIVDATERKRSEDALRRAEKLAVTGRLAASIAHEINNPLEAVTNLLFLLRNFCQLKDPELNYVTMAENEVRRISEITQQTLRFYRQPTLPARVTLPDLLDSVLSLYHGRFNALGIEVEKTLQEGADLFCYAGELRQIFANLVGNSIDALPKGGQLRVRARRTPNWQNPEQSGIRFTVADTGQGMTPDVLKHAFEAFFTTKLATGTGLGLWVSLEIIVKHRGILHLRSRSADKGKYSGTVFQFFIPDDEQELLKTHPPVQNAG